MKRGKSASYEEREKFRLQHTKCEAESQTEAGTKAEALDASSAGA